MRLLSVLYRVAVQGLNYLVNNRQVNRAAIALLFLCIFTSLLSLDLFYGKVDLEVGDVAPRDIHAPRSVEYIDTVKTEELKRQAAESVEKVYTIDFRVISQTEQEIKEFTESIVKIQTDEVLSVEEKVNMIKEITNKELPDEVIKKIATSNPEDLYLIRDKLTGVIILQMEKGIDEEKLDQAKGELVAQINEFNFNPGYYQYAVWLIDKFVKPSRFYDAEQTEILRQRAVELVEPVKVQIKAQQKIVSKGEIVTEQHIQALQALGMLHPSRPWVILLGNTLLVAVMMGIVLFYLRRQNRAIYNNTAHLCLIGIIVTIVLIVSKSILLMEILLWPEFEERLGYLSPVAAGGMLVAILLKTRLAILIVAVMSLIVGSMIDNQIAFSIAGFIGGITGIYSVTKLSQRGDLARAGLYTGVAVMLSIFIIGMIEETSWQLLIVSSVILGLLNGLLSSVLTNGALPYLESFFGITSPVKLLELSNPSNKLLRRLLLEAPGTYHHSIMVGNLAEAATEAVNGDHLLVRVGAMYHDIGKVKRPYFFVENQLGMENPHDKIAPTLSALIITSHVKDGVEIAKEHKLPQCIIDFIEQHHGTSLIKYFYHKALEMEGPEKVVEDAFRHGGPKPQTKEVAIVMLADTVEAAVRALKNPSSGQIEGLVRETIKEKLMDGQLDECDLTLKDLDTIANAFVRVLSGAFHSRIEYPDLQENERRKNGNSSIG